MTRCPEPAFITTMPIPPSDDLLRLAFSQPGFDIHTHNLAAPAGAAVVNMPRQWLEDPSTATLRPGVLYSAGVHPWWTACEADLPPLLAGLDAWTGHPQVVAIGECGLDRLHGANLDRQCDIFTRQIRLATATARPLIIHCVKAYDLLLRLRKTVTGGSAVPWIIHGFRGRPALARQLLAAGCCLSYGSRYNAESCALTPPDRRLHETDED